MMMYGYKNVVTVCFGCDNEIKGIKSKGSSK